MRQRRITGVFQHQKNAKMWFNAYGVLEAWKLWAKHTGADPETNMPPDVRRVSNAIAAAAANGRSTGREAPLVTVTVPFGTEVKIVYDPPEAPRGLRGDAASRV